MTNRMSLSARMSIFGVCFLLDFPVFCQQRMLNAGVAVCLDVVCQQRMLNAGVAVCLDVVCQQRMLNAGVAVCFSTTVSF